MYIDAWLWAFTRGVRGRIAGATLAGLLSVLVGTGRLALLGWVLGCFVVYAALFGAGSFLYGRQAQGAVWTVVFAVAAAGLIRVIRGVWRTEA